MNRVVVDEEGKRSAARAGRGVQAKQKMRGSHATHSVVKGFRYDPLVLVLVDRTSTTTYTLLRRENFQLLIGKYFQLGP
jgi:hypothetical protein